MISHGYQHVVAMHHLRFTQNMEKNVRSLSLHASRASGKWRVKSAKQPERAREMGNKQTKMKKTREQEAERGPSAEMSGRQRYRGVCVHSDTTAGQADPHGTFQLRGLMCRRSCLHTEIKAKDPLLLAPLSPRPLCPPAQTPAPASTVTTGVSGERGKKRSNMAKKFIY